MRILITGSSGQIGTNLALRLIEDGHWVFGVEANGNSAVVYATRTGPSQWTATTLVQDVPFTLSNPTPVRSKAARASWVNARWT